MLVICKAYTCGTPMTFLWVEIPCFFEALNQEYRYMICVCCAIMKNTCSFKHDGIPINLSMENPLVCQTKSPNMSILKPRISCFQALKLLMAEILHQLTLVVYPFIYRVFIMFYTPEVAQDFFYQHMFHCFSTQLLTSLDLRVPVFLPSDCQCES